MYLWDERYVTMTRGDTMSFGIEIEGLEQDLDTASLLVSENLMEKPAFIKTLGNGITKVGEGQYTVRIAPEDTRDLKPGKYHYNLEIGVNGDIFTVLKGILDIERDVI